MKHESFATAAEAFSPLRSALSASAVQSSHENVSCTVALADELDPSQHIGGQVEALAGAIQNSQHGDEECLESYLQQYMQRLTGKTQSGGTVSLEAKNSIELDAVAGPEEPFEEMPQRMPTQAPEQRDQLAAMRVLANESARRAVAQSSNVEQVVKMRRAFYEAKAASIASTTLAIAFFATSSTIALASASFLFLAAVVLSYRFLRLSSS